MDVKKIQEELSKSRRDYDALKRKELPAELEAARAREKVAEAQRVLQKLEADAAKKTQEYANIQAHMAQYRTEVESLERELKAEAQKLKER